MDYPDVLASACGECSRHTCSHEAGPILGQRVRQDVIRVGRQAGQGAGSCAASALPLALGRHNAQQGVGHLLCGKFGRPCPSLARQVLDGLYRVVLQSHSNSKPEQGQGVCRATCTCEHMHLLREHAGEGGHEQKCERAGKWLCMSVYPCIGWGERQTDTSSRPVSKLHEE